MAGRKSDFTLTKLDDLFTTQAQREEEKLSKIRDIPLGLIDDFPDHPFKVRDDEDMLQLIESIRDRGVITPASFFLIWEVVLMNSRLRSNDASRSEDTETTGGAR